MEEHFREQALITQVRFKFFLDVEGVYVLQKCMFVCFISKAQSQEAVNDLSANSFSAVLKPFVGSIGKSEELYSDWGKNILERDIY